MAEPGWYQDPSNPAMDRWWSGTAWGADTRPAYDGPVAAARQQQKKQKGGCFGIATGVMFGIVGAMVLLVGGCVALVAGTSGTTERTSINTTTPTGADEAAEQSAETVVELAEIDDYVSCQRVDGSTLIVEFVNNSPETSSYFATVALLDDAGQRLADEMLTLSALRPGERSIEAHFTFEEVGSACEVVEVDRFSAVSDPTEAGEVGECAIDGQDALGDLKASVSATNNTPNLSDYSIEVAFVDAEGIRRGSGDFFIASVRPGETAPGEALTTMDYVDGLRCEVVGVERTAS